MLVFSKVSFQGDRYKSKKTVTISSVEENIYPVRADLLIGHNSNSNQGTAVGNMYPGVDLFSTYKNAIEITTSEDLSEYYARVAIFYTKV